MNVPINDDKTQLMIIQGIIPGLPKVNNSRNNNTKINNKIPSITDIIANADYKLNDRIMEKKQWIKILGIKIDTNLTFKEQITHSIQTMGRARYRCHNLIRNNIQHIQMETIRKLAESISMIHLNYCGSIILTLSDDRSIEARI